MLTSLLLMRTKLLAGKACVRITQTSQQALNQKKPQGSKKKKWLDIVLFVQGNGLLFDVAFDNVPELPEDGERGEEVTGDVTDGREVMPF